MRFIVDECTGPQVARWLLAEGHEVFSVYDKARGMDDIDIIQKAFSENWVLITNDKDFGEQIYRENRPHRGVILMHLKNERAANKVATLQRLLTSHADKLAGRFVVVTETTIRIRR